MITLVTDSDSETPSTDHTDPAGKTKYKWDLISYNTTNNLGKSLLVYYFPKVNFSHFFLIFLCFRVLWNTKFLNVVIFILSTLIRCTSVACHLFLVLIWPLHFTKLYVRYSPSVSAHMTSSFSLIAWFLWRSLITNGFIIIFLHDYPNDSGVSLVHWYMN